MFKPEAKQKIANFLIDLSLFFVTISPFIYLGNYFYNPRSTPRITFWALGVVFALVGFIFLEAKNRAKILRRFSHPIMIALLLYIAWLLIRWFFNLNELGWWGSWGRNNGIWLYLSWSVILPIFAQRFQEQPKLKKIVLWLFVFLAAGVTLLTPLVSGLVPGDLFDSVRWSGLVGNALYLAGIILFVPWAVWQAEENNPRQTFLVVAATIITGFILYMSETRGAEIAFLVGLGVFGLDYFVGKIKNKLTKKIFLASSLVGAVLAVVLFLQFGGINYLEKISSRASTVQDRLILWQLVSADVKERPLVGYGPGSLWAEVGRHSGALARTAQNQFFDASHSGVLDILIESGSIGLILFLLWLGRIYFNSSDNSSSENLVRRACRRASLAAYLVAAASAFFHPWSAVPLLLLVASDLKEGDLANKNWQIGLDYLQKVIMVVVGGSALVIIFTVPLQGWRSHEIQNNLTHGSSLIDLVNNYDQVSGWFPYSLDRDIYLSDLLAARLTDNATAPPASVTNQIVKKILPHFDRYISGTDWVAEAYFTTAFLYRAVAVQAGANRADLLAVSGQLIDRALRQDSNNPKFTVERATFLVSNNQVEEAVQLLRDYRHKNPFVRYVYFYEIQILQTAGRALEAADTARDLIKVLGTIDNDVDLAGLQKYVAGVEENHFADLTPARKKIFEFWLK